MSKEAVRRIGLQFDDNTLVPFLFGEHDRNLAQIEEELDVEISARGNELVISGEKIKLKMAQTVFDVLWDRLLGGLEVTKEDVSAALQVALSPLDPQMRSLAKAALKEPHLKTKGKTITPRTPATSRPIATTKTPYSSNFCSI